MSERRREEEKITTARVVKNYITEQSAGFNNGSISAAIDVEIDDLLGRAARGGYIYARTNNVLVKINNGSAFTIDQGNIWSPDSENVILSIEKIKLSPATAGVTSTIRLFLA